MERWSLHDVRLVAVQCLFLEFSNPGEAVTRGVDYGYLSSSGNGIIQIYWYSGGSELLTLEASYVAILLLFLLTVQYGYSPGLHHHICPGPNVQC